jgi:aryl-alcohol dehydrogenase-like predicted oxidoreductase
VLDRRLVQSGWLDRLLEQDVRVHARSAFLQGLLLMPVDQLPDYFTPWQVLLSRWHAWCAKLGKTPVQAALAYLHGIGGIERVVVGVDSPEQLQDILMAVRSEPVPPPADLYSQDLPLIEPFRWKLT